MTDAAPLTSTNAALIICAKAWKDAGHGVALAFVMETWGSSPRPVGSVMVIRDDMAVEGSVSGGCVEGAVIDAAIESLTTGAGQRLDFGVADAKAWEVEAFRLGEHVHGQHGRHLAHATRAKGPSRSLGAKASSRSLGGGVPRLASSRGATTDAWRYFTM